MLILSDKGLGIPPWIEAFAFDLEVARDIFTAYVRREVRPRVDALAKNRHFFAAEAIEAIFMLFFLLHAAKVRSSCEEGPGQSALQSAYHNPKLDVTELKQHRTP